MKADPQHKTEIYLLLANAYLNETPAQIGGSDGAERASIWPIKNSAAADRQKGLLQKARIQLRMDKLDECRATLKEIPEEATEYPAAMVIGGQALMREAQLLHGKTPEVSEENTRSMPRKIRGGDQNAAPCRGSRAATGSEAMRQAMYLIGVCFMETGDTRAANDQFTRTAQAFIRIRPKAWRPAFNKRSFRAGRATTWKCFPNIAACSADSTSRSPTTIPGFRSERVEDRG